MQTAQQQRQSLVIALAITLVMGVISVWLNPIINNDGIEYLATAQAIVDGNWALALEKYKWPFYPLYIAVLMKVGMGSIPAAWTVNMILQLLTAAGFMRVFRQLRAPESIMLWVYIFVIGASALSEYRWMLIRDFGFLAGWLWGLSYVLQSYFDNRSHIVKILGCFLFAVCFRVEALLLVLTVPIILTAGRRALWRNICYVLACALLMSVLSGLWLSNGGFIAALRGNGVAEAFANGWQDIVSSIELTRLRLVKFIFRHELEHLATPVFYFSIALMVLWSFVKLAQIGYILLTIWSRQRFGPYFDKGVRDILILYFSLFISLMLIYAFLRFYSTERYALPAWSVFVLLVPYAAANLWQWGKNAPQRWSMALCYFLISIGVIYVARSALERGERQYLREAGTWIKDNISEEARIFTGNRIVVFYSQRHREKTRIYEPYEAFLFASARAVWVPYDYVVAEVRGTPGSNRMNEFEGYYKRKPIKVFTNNQHNSIAIYDVRDVQ